jgi:hypothetical protein
VATASENRLSINRNLYTSFAAASDCRAIAIYEYTSETKTVNSDSARGRIRDPSPDTSPPQSGDSAYDIPARSEINPTGKKSDKAKSWPSFSFRTDLDRVYLELGGPAPLRGRVDRNTFARCSKEFSWRKVEPTLRRFQKDQNFAKRHWPWVAFALSQYRFERNQLQRRGATLNPSEVVELLNDIRRSAKKLASSLGRLQEASYSVGDPAARSRKPHLAYLHQFISQAAAGHIAAEVNKSGEHMARVFFCQQSFLNRLIEVEVAAGEAAKRADKSLLKRKKGQADPALYNLVWRGAEIWSSLTGRVPSANRVNRGVSGEEPDFVLFIQDLVRLAGGERPSRKVVEISLGNRRTPDAG